MKEQSTKKSFLQVLQDKIMPIANKIGEQKHMKAISSGLMYLIPLSLLGAVFNIIANPPITESIIKQGGVYSKIFSGWYYFAKDYKTILNIPPNMTVGLMSIVAVVGISYNLAKSYKMKELSTAILSLIMFLIVAAPSESAYLASIVTPGADIAKLQVTSVLNTSYLGAPGLFVAIIIGLLSTEVTRFCNVKNLKITMPDSVPPAVSESFSAVIPAMINCIIFFGADLLLRKFAGLSLPAAITSVLTPAISNINTPVAIIAINALGNFLWLFGIHGAAITSMLYIPVSLSLTGVNAALVAGGQSPVFEPVFLTTFANAYFGLNILLLFAKSKQLKAVGKVSIIPGVFMISEPVIFGVPIMFNPILAIPHLLAPIISMILAYIAYSIGFLGAPFNILFARLPLGLNAFFGSMDFNNLIFSFLLIGVHVLIWYPFFKVYDRQLEIKEKEMETETEAIDV